jgi:NAD(P)-dependent dehydrogenase (short-subunit alcohol dehydrogenase family)
MKRIFLTGASSGIGLAIAEALVARGDEVWGTSRNLIRLEHLRAVHPVRLDLTDSRSIDEAFKCALGEAGSFDVVINNAGNGHFGPGELLSVQEIQDQFQVLLYGHIRLIRLALAGMRAHGGGMIINVTSLASRLPVPFMAAYNAAKAAMASFTMTMQLELPDNNIRLIDLQPADICTGFNDAIPKSGGNDPRYDARVAKTWEAVDRNMKNAPKPQLVAEHVLRLMDSTNPPPRITVGDFFQTRIAPFIFRFLPQRVRNWGLKIYYGI